MPAAAQKSCRPVPPVAGDGDVARDCHAQVQWSADSVWHTEDHELPPAADACYAQGLATLALEGALQGNRLA